MGLWEGSSTSLEGPRSHLGSAQEAGETEERFVLPFSRFGSLSGGAPAEPRTTARPLAPRVGWGRVHHPPIRRIGHLPLHAPRRIGGCAGALHWSGRTDQA